MILRPSSAVAPTENNRGLGGTSGKNRPHTALAAVKQLLDSAAPEVTDDSSGESVYSDDEIDQDSDANDENMEMMLGLSDAVLDDDVRDVVMRMNEHKQYVQARRRTAVSSVMDKRPPSGKRSQQKCDSETSDEETRKDGDHFDRETSDEALRHLEDKLRDFYNNNEPDGVEGRRKTAVVQQMKRFSVKVCKSPSDQDKEHTVTVKE
jgi:hypothetical protein